MFLKESCFFQLHCKVQSGLASKGRKYAVRFFFKDQLFYNFYRKLKYGHRGGNHPVKDLQTGRVYISSQNHGYAVDADSIPESVAVPAFVNVNDKTNEGMSYVGKNIFTVQFHPEACPGPQDSGYLFDRFMDMMGGTK